MKLGTRDPMWALSPDALLVIAPDGCVLHWNLAAERMYGYSANEALDRALNSLVVPHDRVAEEQSMQAEALRVGLVVYETVRHQKDGTLVHVNISTRAVYGEDGLPAYFVSNQRDVTQLKVQRDAKLLQARFQDLLESMPDAVLMVNVTGRVVLLNSQAEKMFGHSRAELLGQPAEVLLPQRFHGSRPGHLVAFFLQAHAHPVEEGLELYGLRKSGEEFPMEASLGPLDTEEGPMVMAAIRDISDRKKADRKFRDLLESAPDAMVIVNRDGVMVLVNSQAAHLFGWSRDELLGEPVEILVPERFRSGHPDKRSGFFMQPEHRSLGAGCDLMGLRKDGTEFPVEISLSPLETEEGLFISSAIRDVTDRKRIEQALRDKNRELEEAAMAKDRFFASMSHELRTPLNAIIGFTGTLRMKLPGPLNAEQDKQLQIVQTSGRHLLSLINDLLDLAKLGANKMDLTLEKLDCSALLEEAAAALRPQAEKKGLTLGLQLPPSPLLWSTDERSLKQIMLNLLGNAIKFTEQGGVSVRMEIQEAPAEPRLLIHVEDTGPGISPEDQGQLFDALSRAQALSRRKLEGSGLGLHLSHKLAQALGGELRFRSVAGTGSTFTLELPGR